MTYMNKYNQLQFDKDSPWMLDVRCLEWKAFEYLIEYNGFLVEA